MRLSLVTAAIATDFEDVGEVANRQVRKFRASSQLGTLSLAAVLEQIGATPHLLNLDQLYYKYLNEFGARGLKDFPAWVAPLIVSSQAEIYGFSSICSSYPLTIRIAESVKREMPDCTILFGGPQASVVDLRTLEAFPFVDFVLRGEAEQTLPLFLEQWSGQRRFSTVPGLSYRSAFGPVRNADATVIADLDSLPLPAYHLTDDLEGASYAPLELGRGCPFACTFCSTNDFFRRKFRVKSPEHMLAQMRAIHSTYDVRAFELTHDMFTVDRRRVVAFCRHLLDESRERFSWSCSARTDCVDEELLELMAAAGCTGMFFGVETGSKRMQRIIDKDLDPDYARVMIETAERVGIETTVSLIMGYPEENLEDLRDTASIYMHSMRRQGSTPLLNLLAPLAGTPIYSRHKDQIVLEDLGSEMSHQGRTQNEADRALIRRYPHIFPNFYLIPAPSLDRAFCIELREFLRFGEVRLRWLLTALDQSGLGILDVFSKWRERRLESHPELSGGDLRYYYMQKRFADEFVAFVRRLPDFENPAVEALVNWYEVFIAEEASDSGLPREHPQVYGPALPCDIPVRMPGLHVLELDWDIQAVIDSVKRAESTPQTRTRKFYRTAETGRGASRLIEITPLVARGLRACDGGRTVEEFIIAISECFEGPLELRRQAAECLLEGIRKKGFIEIRRAPWRRPLDAVAAHSSGVPLATNF